MGVRDASVGAILVSHTFDSVSYNTLTLPPKLGPWRDRLTRRRGIEELGSEACKEADRERFGEEIRRHLISGKVLDSNVLLSHEVADKVMADENMTGVFRNFWCSSKVDSRLVVFEASSRTWLLEAKFTEEATEEKTLLACIGEANILCFHAAS